MKNNVTARINVTSGGIQVKLAEWAKLILFISFVLYVVAWSLFTLMRFYSFHAGVYDLGLVMERLWQVYSTKWTVSQFLYYFFNSGIIFVVFPLSFGKSFLVLLVAQTLLLGGASFPIFYIAKHHLKSEIDALLIAVSYLLFFPIAGINWFDFHFQMLFIPFFLFAYYFLLKERYFLAFFFFVFSGMVRFPYVIFPALFALLSLLSYFWNVRIGIEADKRTLYFSVALLSICIFFFAGAISFVFAPSNLLSSVHTTSNGSLITNLPVKLLTFVLLFAPLMFLPILSKKWVLFTLPFLYLLFFSNFSGYEFPSLFNLQYSAGIVPFLYLGLIDTLSSNKGKSFLKNGKIFLIKIFRPSKVSRTKMTFSILIIVALMALYFQPYGPLNSYSPNNFSLNSQTDANFTMYKDFQKTVGLIPQNNPFVVIQNNLPQALPRFYNNGVVLIPAVIQSNISIGNAIKNDFPVGNGFHFNTSIDYLLADANDYTFHSSFSGMLMYKLLNTLIMSGKYGILSEQSGIILLGRDFHGPPLYYTPISTSLAFSQNGRPVAFMNAQNQTIYSVYNGLSLLPGQYEMTLNMQSANISQATNVTFSLLSSFNRNLSINYSIDPKILTSASGYVNLTFSMSSEFSISGVFFSLSASQLRGGVQLRGVNIVQTGY